MSKKSLEEILNEALMDEYKARDSYQKIIDTFGPVRPFINIVKAEQRHIEHLMPLYTKYGITLPAEPDPEKIVVPATLLDACRSGVKAEIENMTMYDELIEATEFSDVQEVLRLLQTASRENHLPAFQRCVERGGADRQGGGPGSAGRGGNRGGGQRRRRGQGFDRFRNRCGSGMGCRKYFSDLFPSNAVLCNFLAQSKGYFDLDKGSRLNRV